MDWTDWASFVAQVEALWHSPAFPMWATLTAAAFFSIVLLITLLRADRSVANGALAVITLLAVGVAAAATVRGTRDGADGGATESSMAALVGQGALACLDGLAGDRVETACEKALFASADSTAAAVSYTAAQISRLPVAASQQAADLATLRRVLERDRYGLAAQVLTAREGCTPTACEAFRYLSNSSQIVANMEQRAFETLIARHEENWDGPSKGANIDYPSAASIPPVSIMTPEPARAAAEPRPEPRPEPATQAAAPAAPPAPAPGPAPVVSPHMALPPNSLPFPGSSAQSNAQVAPPAAQPAPAPVKRAAPPPAPAKRAAGPAPVQLVPQ